MIFSGLRTAAAAGAITSALMGSADASTWTDNAGNDLFSDSGNWSAGVPGATDEALFDGPGGPVVFGSDVSVDAVTVRDASVSFDGGSDTFSANDVDIAAGFTPSSGALTLSSGLVNAGRTTLGGAAGAVGQLTVSHGATWNTPGSLTVGDAGLGRLHVEGALATSTLWSAQRSGGQGEITITGQNAALTATDSIFLGSRGSSGMLVDQGAIATTELTTIGQFGSGYLRVDHGAIFNGGDLVLLGSQAQGRLDVFGGAQLNTSSMLVASGSGDGDLYVGGAQTILNVVSDLRATFNESTLTLGDGARMIVGGGNLAEPTPVANTMVWGFGGGHAEGIVDGAKNAALTVIGEMVIGDGGTSTETPDYATPDPTQGEMIFRNGTVSSAQRLVLGQNGATAYVVVDDPGTVLSTGELIVGGATQNEVPTSGDSPVVATGRTDGKAYVYVRTGAELRVNGQLTVMPDAVGSFTVDGLLNAQAIDLGQGGVISGRGQVTGNVTNSGTLQPGNSPGILFVDGDYAQTADGQLDIELGGDAPGETQDLLQITGEAELGGTLHLGAWNAFVPEVGDIFTVLQAGRVTGTFDAVTADPAFAHLRFMPVYDTNGVRIAVQAIPEPGTLLLAAAGGAALIRRRSRG